MTNLTQPRYLVIAEDTSGNWKKDNIIELAENYPFSGFTIEVKGNMYGSEMFANYPHLFRLLHWWEYRELSDLPIYVKYSTKGKIIKVKWIYVQDGEGKVQLENGGYRLTWSFNLFEPATLNEYNEYIKNK